MLSASSPVWLHWFGGTKNSRRCSTADVPKIRVKKRGYAGVSGGSFLGLGVEDSAASSFAL